MCSREKKKKSIIFFFFFQFLLFAFRLEQKGLQTLEAVHPPMPFVVKLFTSCMCVYRFSRHPKPRTKRISLPFLYPPPHFFFFFPVTTTANEHKQPAGSGRPTIQALRQENSNYLIKRGQPRQPPPPLLITRRCVYLCACVLFDLCAHRIDTSQQKFETHKRKKERKRSLAIFAFFSSSGIKTSLWKGKVLGRRSEMIEPVFV